MKFSASINLWRLDYGSLLPIYDNSDSENYFLPRVFKFSYSHANRSELAAKGSWVVLILANL